MSTEQKELKAELAGGFQRSEEPFHFDSLSADATNFVHCDFAHYDSGDMESKSIKPAPIVNNSRTDLQTKAHA